VVVAAFAIPSVGLAQPADQRQVDAKREVERQQARLEDAVERYNYACSRLEQTLAELEQNEADLAKAEQELQHNKKNLLKRVRAMYVRRPNQFLDVVVNAEDFDSLLRGLDLQKKVSAQDAALVRKVKEAKAKLEGARAELKNREQEQASIKKEMSSAKAAVEGDLAGAQGNLANIEEEIRQAMARRAAEAESASRNVSPGRRYSDPEEAAPVVRRTAPPGTPHGGVVDVAYAQLGKPYVWGAEGPNSFDCSGLTMYCYRVGAGIYITHSSYGQASCGTPVSVSELAPGDILGFRGWGHVGLYVGGGEFIHAPQSGDVVKVTSLASRSNFCGAVRP